MINNTAVTHRHTLYTNGGAWLADVLYTEDGILAIDSDYGNFCYRWRMTNETMSDFLLRIGPDYLASKLEMSMSYTIRVTATARKSIRHCCDIVLPALKDSIRSASVAPNV